MMHETNRVERGQRRRVTLLRFIATPRSSSRLCFLIYMFTLLLVRKSLMCIQTWFLFCLSLKLYTPLQLLSLLLSLLLLFFLLLGSTHAVFFAVIHNADASSSDIDPHVSGRSPQTSRICNGAYVATDVATDQVSPGSRNIAHVSPQPGSARSVVRWDGVSS